MLDGDGSLRYSLGPQGLVHGDRFHIADMDPSRPGLEGYGAARYQTTRLLTFDQRHFRVVAPLWGAAAFTVLPADG